MSDPQEVVLVAFNAGMQMAVDEDDRIWVVDMWMDADGDEIMNRFENPDQFIQDKRPNVNWEEWENVESVTAYSDFPEGRKWTSFRPDDFPGASER